MIKNLNTAGNTEFIAKTFAGLENVLAGELSALGASGIQIIQRGVKFKGDKTILYESNHCCRTALRVLMPVAVFHASGQDTFYKKIYDIDWSAIMHPHSTFMIDTVTSYSALNHSQFVSLKTKDAIVDQFRNNTGIRPSVNTLNPDFRINVRIFRDECTVSLDSSGDPLFKRGYRVAHGPAPLNEVLAAGMILLSGWEGRTPLLDPMCGSGTIPVEAALLAMGIPPGSFRKKYAFMHWRDFDESLWKKIKTYHEPKELTLPAPIAGSDMSGTMILNARKNADNTPAGKSILFKTSFFKDLEPTYENGMIIMNPPYNERIRITDINRLYAEMGEVLKSKYAGWSAWILSGDPEAMKHVGLRPSKKYRLYNGELECLFARFDMYEGSRKASKQHS